MYKKPEFQTLKLKSIDQSLNEECLISRGLEEQRNCIRQKFKYALETPMNHKRQSSSGRNSYQKLSSFDFLNNTQIKTNHKKTYSIVLSYFKNDKINQSINIPHNLYGFSKLTSKLK